MAVRSTPFVPITSVAKNTRTLIIRRFLVTSGNLLFILNIIFGQAKATLPPPHPKLRKDNTIPPQRNTDITAKGFFVYKIIFFNIHKEKTADNYYFCGILQNFEKSNK